MAFKRSAVRSRLPPPRSRLNRSRLFFFPSRLLGRFARYVIDRVTRQLAKAAASATVRGRASQLCERDALERLGADPGPVVLLRDVDAIVQRLARAQHAAVVEEFAFMRNRIVVGEQLSVTAGPAIEPHRLASSDGGRARA